MHMAKTDLLGKFHRIGKFLFGFPGETDYNICGKVKQSILFPYVFNYFHVILHRVHPAHLQQDTVTSALQAQVKVRCQFGMPYKTEEMVIKAVWFDRRNPYPEIPFNIKYLFKQT